MVSDRQVRLLRKKRMGNKTLEAAASAAGMSERTARKWQKGVMPSETKQERGWRTRPDPFEEVWDSEVEPLADFSVEVSDPVNLIRALEQPPT